MSQNNWEEQKSFGSVCPTCGEEFKNEFGMKQHHARGHGKSLLDVDRKCSYCGDEMTLDLNRRGDNERVFCGFDCYTSWQSENLSGENSHNYKGKVEVECEWCGEVMEKYPYYAKNHTKFYCSDECEVRFKHSRTGSDAPSWEGGYISYGEGWNDEKKIKVRNRDDNTCQHPGCDMSNREHLEKYGKSLEVHHIQNRREFADPHKRNSMSNLVALCLKHHREWEKMSPLKPANSRTD